MKELVYRSEAVADIQSAVDWYEQQRPGLGDEFLEELRSTERRVRRSPTSHRIIHRDTRRRLMHRFPYQLLYRVVEDIVVVVGCFHVRRSPRRMRARR